MQRLIFSLAALSSSVAAGAAQPAQRPVGSNNSSAATSCLVNVTLSPSSWIIEGYDPFGSGAAEGIYTITYTNTGTGECVFTPVFRSEQPPSGLRAQTGSALDYSLVDITSSQNVTPRAGQSQRNGVRGVFELAPNASKVVTYRLAVAAEGVTRHGEFSEVLSVEARDTADRSVGGAQLTIGLNVLPSARLGLSGAYTISNGQALVNLGDLREGPAAVPLQLRVQSTGRYSLSFESRNSGQLRMTGTDWAVPYSIKVGGQAVNLSNGQIETAGPNEDGLTRSALPIQFQIGSTEGRRAGTYSDLISVSIAPR